jgi:hypothetical protein
MDESGVIICFSFACQWGMSSGIEIKVLPGRERIKWGMGYKFLTGIV